MAKQIKWNKRALSDFKAIAEYLEENFSFQSAQNFVDQIYEKIDVINKHPIIGRKAPKRKAVRFFYWKKIEGYTIAKKAVY